MFHINHLGFEELSVLVMKLEYILAWVKGKEEKKP